MQTKSVNSLFPFYPYLFYVSLEMGDSPKINADIYYSA